MSSAFIKGLLLLIVLLIALSCPSFLAKIEDDDTSRGFSLSYGFYFRKVSAGRMEVFCFLTEKDFLAGDSIEICLLVLLKLAFLLISWANSK